MSRSKLLLTNLIAALLYFAALPTRTALAASTETERVRISYEAPPGCPTQERFLAQVGSRAFIPWLAEETELARPIRITIEPSGSEFTARMQYADHSGQQIVRSVQAPNCEQAVAGIALVASIAIESLAETTAAVNADLEGHPKQTEGSETATRDASRQGTNSTGIQNSESPGMRETPNAPVERRVSWAPPATAEVRPIVHEIEGLVGAGYGLGPGAALGGGVGWGIGRQRYPTIKFVASWFEYRQSVSPGDVVVASQFRLLAITPQLCGARKLNGNPVMAGLCAGVEFGQYRAKGATNFPRIFTTNTIAHPWAAIQVTAPLRVTIGGLFLELQPLIRFPMVSNSFKVMVNGRDTPVYDTPRVAFGLNIEIGWRFGESSP